MAALPEGWTEQDGRLVREFCFADFATAMAFVADVGHAAEAQDHHPQWTNLGARVSMQLWSHDIARNLGGLGSRLHRLDDGTHAAYAQWPSRELWQAAQDPTPKQPNPQVQRWQEQMRQAVAETLPITTMDVAEDLLKARFLGPRGD